MNFRMTYNEALAIQAEQLDHYCRVLRDDESGAALRKTIAERTKPCPWGPDEPRFVGEINDLVPRGVDIEVAAGLHWPKTLED